MFLFLSWTLNFLDDFCCELGDVSPSLGDVTKTWEEDIDTELLDHWLRRSWQQHSSICAGCKFYWQLLPLFSGTSSNQGSDTSLSSGPMVTACPWSEMTGVMVFLTLGECSVSTRDDSEAEATTGHLPLSSPCAVLRIIVMEPRNSLRVCKGPSTLQFKS